MSYVYHSKVDDGVTAILNSSGKFLVRIRSTQIGEFESKSSYDMKIKVDDIEAVKTIKFRCTKWNCIGIRPGPNCKPTCQKEWFVSVTTPLGMAPTTPESRVTTKIRINSRASNKYYRTEIQLRAIKTVSIYNFFTPVTSKSNQKFVSWQLVSNCDGKNLTVGLTTDATLDAKPESQKLSPLFEKIVNSFICRNP